MVSVLVLVLIITGLVNLHRIDLMETSAVWGTSYGITVGIKVSLALAMFVAFPFIFILVHRYGSDDLEARINRMNYLHWGITLITLVIMYLGVLI
jgi:Sec-independent protein secretion pathway component TatC